MRKGVAATMLYYVQKRWFSSVCCIYRRGEEECEIEFGNREKEKERKACLLDRGRERERGRWMDVTGGWVSIHCHITLLPLLARWLPPLLYIPPPPTDMLRSKRSLIDFQRARTSRGGGDPPASSSAFSSCSPSPPFGAGAFRRCYFAWYAEHDGCTVRSEWMDLLCSPPPPIRQTEEERGEEPFDIEPFRFPEAELNLKIAIFQSKNFETFFVLYKLKKCSIVITLPKQNLIPCSIVRNMAF